MTKAELLREVNLDSDWIFDRSYGITRKYARQLKKFSGEIMLGVSTYKTPRHNEAIAVWGAISVGKHEYRLTCYVYFKYFTPAGFQYIASVKGKTQNLIVYTVHFIKRLKEREGLSFLEYIQLLSKGASFVGRPNKYIYKGKEVDVFPFLDRGFQIFKHDNWGMMMVTYISKSQYHDEQEAFINQVIEETKSDNQSFLADVRA